MHTPPSATLLARFEFLILARYNMIEHNLSNKARYYQRHLRNCVH
jgi:hypothetical protein